MASNNVDVLAFGPHPDDIEMGCGGTLVKLKDIGYSIGVIDLTAGEMGTRGTAQLRARESEKASEILGVEFRKNLNMPDGRLWNNDDNRKKVIGIIRTYRSKIIISAHWLDDHPDHVQGAHILKDAYYMAGFRNMYGDLESHRPAAILYYMCRQEFEPTFIVDITKEFDRKMDAVKAYASQFYNSKSDEPETPLSHPDFLDLFTVRAKYYGKMIGCTYGEPFFTKYPPPVDDPVAVWK